MLRAAAKLEKLGMPTVSIITTGFLKQAGVVARGLGLPLAIAEYPGNPAVDSVGELNAKVDTVLAPAMSRALTTRATSDETAGKEPASEDVVFSGSLDQVQDYFERQLWSDGLPVVPPTAERVAAFLAHTRRKPGEVLRVVPLESREVTIHSIALHGVMAGCKPETMPLLIAIIEAVCDPRFRIQQCGTTPGWESLITVNGPIVERLGFNSGEGVMRVGRRANTSVGRFLRLYLRNICGFRIPPGAGDKGSIGQSFLVALAENEAAAREVGWPTFAQDRGFAAGDDVATVRSVVCMTPPMFSSGDRAMDHVPEWTQIMVNTFQSWVHTDFKAGYGSYLIVVPPLVARVVAREWSKDQIRRHIHEHALISVETIEHYAHAIGNRLFSVDQLVRDGTLPAKYAESTDPKRLVPMFLGPEAIDIVIAGDPERNQSRAYMCNHNHGTPTSKRVER